MVVEQVFLELGCGFIPDIAVLGCRVAMASAQEVEMLRRQLDELTAQMIEVRQQSSSTAMNAAVSGLAEAVRTMGQSVSKPRPEDMRVGKPEPYAPGKKFDDGDFTFNGCAGTIDPAYPALLKTARQSPTVVMATPPHEQQSATLDGKSVGRDQELRTSTLIRDHPIREGQRDLSWRIRRVSSSTT